MTQPMTSPGEEMIGLLPCPFCGEAEELYPAHRWPGGGKPYAIDCLGCGADFTPRPDRDVIAAWNRRAPALSALREGGGGEDGSSRADGAACVLADGTDPVGGSDLEEIGLPTPLGALKFRMEQGGHTQTDLANLIGSRSHASEILSGKREPSKAHIRLLVSAWGIPAESLIGASDPIGGAPMDRWQAIDTAPRDGTPILVYLPQAGWEPSLKPTQTVMYWAPWQNFASFYASRLDESEGDAGDWSPTHWRPLPAPPVTDPSGFAGSDTTEQSDLAREASENQSSKGPATNDPTSAPSSDGSGA